MLFSSITFLGFFLPLVLAAYFLVPGLRWKNGLLLAASLLFYAWGEPRFVFVMVVSIGMNWLVGMWLAEPGAGHRKFALGLGVALNLVLLFVFKYLGFSIAMADELLAALHLPLLPYMSFVLPLGISFYTFQAISYLIDVHKSPALVQKNPLSLGLFIAFFPQLVAGPIVRWHDIRQQIASRNHSVDGFAEGLARFIAGLGKKVLLANVFARVSDAFYGADFSDYGVGEAWVACLAYTLQIYYDFSGYSDMAIGLSRMFGFRLAENFNHPYAAASITEFWRRWHISLTSFFRDYLYIPLGGNRKGKRRTVFNRFFVFFATGLWHGAAWNFVLWGLLHGTLMSVERCLPRRWSPGRGAQWFLNGLGRVYTLLSVALLWVLFRNPAKQSIIVVLKMFGINYSWLTEQVYPWSHNAYLLLELNPQFWTAAAVGVLLAVPWWRHLPVADRLSASPVVQCAWDMALLCVFVLCWASLANGSYNPFIYFRF